MQSNSESERKKRQFQRMMKNDELESLEYRCFALERRVTRLERRWNSDPMQQHDLRMARLRVRHELEMLKIDMQDFQRRVEPLLEPQGSASV